MASATGAACSRKDSSDGTFTSVPSGKPSVSRLRLMEKCAWSLTYTRAALRSVPRGGPSRPRTRRRWTSRARFMDMMLAITPPEGKRPNEPSS